MTKAERVQAALASEAVDRVPASFWYHFNLPDPSGRSLADAELAFAKKYDLDFLKVMHDVPYDLPVGCICSSNRRTGAASSRSMPRKAGSHANWRPCP